MPEHDDELRQRIEELEREVAALKQRGVVRGRRERSTQMLWGLPLYDLALGPDPERNEVRGHARGIIAVGDIATGVVAFGGLARGVIALGGAAVGGIAIGGGALGVVAFGGGAIGLLLAVGGGAIGTIAAGSCAIGLVAVGNVAIGYYAMGNVAIGQHVLSAVQQDAEAVRFFPTWFVKLFGF